MLRGNRRRGWEVCVCSRCGEYTDSAHIEAPKDKNWNERTGMPISVCARSSTNTSIWDLCILQWWGMFEGRDWESPYSWVDGISYTTLVHNSRTQFFVMRSNRKISLCKIRPIWVVQRSILHLLVSFPIPPITLLDYNLNQAAPQHCSSFQVPFWRSWRETVNWRWYHLPAIRRAPKFGARYLTVHEAKSTRVACS